MEILSKRLLAAITVALLAGCSGSEDPTTIVLLPPESPEAPITNPPPGENPDAPSEPSILEVQMQKASGLTQILLHSASMVATLHDPAKQLASNNGAVWNCSFGGNVSVGVSGRDFEQVDYFFENCSEQIGVINGNFRRRDNDLFDGVYTIANDAGEWGYSLSNTAQAGVTRLPGEGNVEYLFRSGNNGGSVTFNGARGDLMPINMNFRISSQQRRADFASFNVIIFAPNDGNVRMGLSSGVTNMTFESGIPPLGFKTLSAPQSGEFAFFRSIDGTSSAIRGSLGNLTGTVNAVFEPFRDRWEGGSAQFDWPSLLSEPSIAQNLERAIDR